MLIVGFPTGSFQANCYLLALGPGSDCLVVDPGENAAARLPSLLAEHHLTPAGVLLTHGHLDHVADAATLCRSAGIPAYLHISDEHLLDDPMAGLSDQLRQVLASYPLGDLRPPEVLDVGQQVQAAGLTLSVDHTPGHTQGSVMFRLAGEADRPEVVLTGDTLFAGGVGRTDLPGGSWDQLQRSLRAVVAARPEDAVLLPGHGRSSTIGAERTGNPFLR